MWTNVNCYNWVILDPANYYLSNPDELSKSLICRVTEGKDLGVQGTNDMKTSLQVQKPVAKIMQTLGMLKRSFNSSDSFYSCIKLTSDHILNTVHHLGVGTTSCYPM